MRRYAGFQSFDLVFAVFHLERKLAAQDFDSVDFRKERLKFVKGLEAVFHRAFLV